MRNGTAFLVRCFTAIRFVTWCGDVCPWLRMGADVTAIYKTTIDAQESITYSKSNSITMRGQCSGGGGGDDPASLYIISFHSLSDVPKPTAY